MNRTAITLKIEESEVELEYRFELYPDGKYGFSYSGHDGSRRCEWRVYTYATPSECLSDMT